MKLTLGRMLMTYMYEDFCIAVIKNAYVSVFIEFLINNNSNN